MKKEKKFWNKARADVLGSTFYLARDLLVRVFYALGDARVPFQISTAAIVANALLDWLLVRRAGFGVQGLVSLWIVLLVNSLDIFPCNHFTN